MSGLNVTYAERRIKEFRETAAPPVDRLFHVAHNSKPVIGASRFEARVNMVGIAHALTVEQVKECCAWYGSQKPAPGRGSHQALIEAGRVLYLQGTANKSAPPCQSSHGVQAEGTGKTPRLAGQNGRYLSEELGKFNVGDRQHAPEMTAVAHNLDGAQIRALAAYLQPR